MALRRTPTLRGISARGLVVALGVPAAFAVCASILAFGSPAGVAVAAPAPLQVDVSRAQPVQHDYSVRRTAVINPRNLVHHESVVATRDRVAFITIDDGIVKDRAGLDYVVAHQLPVTAFLTAWTIKDQADYFSRITQWGSIQNHSATHANFTRPSTDLNHEICYSQRMLKRTFGDKSWMLRPPFGAASDRFSVISTAVQCGITDIVLWDAYVYKGKLASAGPLKPGAIVLLHFSKHLKQDLAVAVAAIRQAGLEPANLADYLPQRR